ncbi:MAG: glycoside hydrolase, partial [Flavobacteriaceae bacterium]
PEEPTGKNPPDGAILDYQLNSNVQQVMLEIWDDGGQKIASFLSDDAKEELDSTLMRHPTYWMRPQKSLSTATGHHRFIWNLRHPAPKGVQRGFAIAAVQYDTPSGPNGPFVAPGNYTVKLIADGEVSERMLTVRLDPRVTLSEADAALQSDLSLLVYEAYHDLQTIRDNLDQLLDTTKKGKKKKEALLKFRGDGLPSGGDMLYGSIRETPLSEESIVGLQEKLLFLLEVLQSADAKPTSQTKDAVEILVNRSKDLIIKWNGIK